MRDSACLRALTLRDGFDLSAAALIPDLLCPQPLGVQGTLRLFLCHCEQDKSLANRVASDACASRSTVNASW